MPGLLVHLFIATAGLLIIHFLHFKWEFSFAFFIGHLAPDVIKFGWSAIRQGTLAIFGVEHDAFYQALSEVTSNPANWFAVSFFILGAALLLYHSRYIKKKTMIEYEKLIFFFLLGALMHIILDMYIFEVTPWI